MIFKSLEGISIQDLTHAFNSAFSDYIIPFHFSPDQLAEKLKADKFSPQYSVGAFDGNKLIGFIFHGYEEVDSIKTLYNGGTGVVPQHRGNGLTQQMYDYVLPILKEKEIDRIQLEVISSNLSAIRSYEKTGFTHDRSVTCFKGTILPRQVDKNLNIKIVEQPNWEHWLQFQETSPTWQNSNHVLSSIHDRTLCLNLSKGDLNLGYCIFNPKMNRIHQIGVYADYRRQGIGSQILEYIRQHYCQEISIINIDNNANPLINFFKNSGLQTTIEQIEMSLSI